MITIYHNPRCRKSRECLAILESRDEDVHIVKYLEAPLTGEKLKKILKLLKCNAMDIVRTQEKLWKENFKDLVHNDGELIDLLIKHPKLLERPIVVKDNKAVIGRPPENVLSII